MVDLAHAQAFLVSRFGGEVSDVSGLAYQAYTGDWANLEGTARCTLDLASS